MITLAQAKASLRIASDDSQHDVSLVQYATQAQVRVQADLQPYIDFPLDPGSDLHLQALSLQLLWLKRLWYKDIMNDTLADAQETDYMSTLAGVQSGLEARKTERRRIVAVSQSPAEPVFQPSETDMYLSREFN